MKRPWCASSATQEITLATPCKKIKTFETCVETFEKTKTTEAPIDKTKSERPTMVRLKLRKPSELSAGASGLSSYEQLIENWVPPPPLRFDFSDDAREEWLFGKRRQRNKECGSKRWKPSNEVLGCRGSTMWPQAQPLPDAGGLYALPYTVPF